MATMVKVVVSLINQKNGNVDSPVASLSQTAFSHLVRRCACIVPSPEDVIRLIELGSSEKKAHNSVLESLVYGRVQDYCRYLYRDVSSEDAPVLCKAIYDLLKE